MPSRLKHLPHDVQDDRSARPVSIRLTRSGSQMNGLHMETMSQMPSLTMFCMTARERRPPTRMIGTSKDCLMALACDAK